MWEPIETAPKDGLMPVMRQVARIEQPSDRQRRMATRSVRERRFMPLLYCLWQHMQAEVLDLYFQWQYSRGMVKKRTGSKRLREVPLQVRITPTEKTAFDRAATIAGIGLSAWARQRLRQAAVREMEEAGEVAPFLLDPESSSHE